MRGARSIAAAAVAALVAAATAGACSGSSSTTAAPGTSSSVTSAPTSTTSSAVRSGGATDAGRDDRADGGGSEPGDDTRATTGLATSDLEQLRSIYLGQGFDGATTDCVLSSVEAALRDEVVTQAALEAALTDATVQCGGGAGGSGSGGGGSPDLVRGIIDNYPTGGVPSSTTLVPAGGAGGYPTGG